TDRLADLIPAVGLFKEPAQPLRAYVHRDTLGVDSRSRLLNDVFADIGGEDLDLDIACDISEMFKQADGQRIWLFSSGTAGNPDTQRSAWWTIVHKGRKGGLFQCFECFWIAKEARNIDQYVRKQVLNLVRVFP